MFHLHGRVAVAHGTEHALRDRPQLCAIGLKPFRQELMLLHVVDTFFGLDPSYH
jgi:hypothetical protein